MKTVITYGTFDLIHYGHIRLLERAKKLGDYLIVGVTSDDFDKSRGKINAYESVEERIENVRNTGLADKIIIEEYEGQKIDDVKKYNVDIFTVGSDWIGKFDYLKKYCEVIYLERTKGISSSEIRNTKGLLNIGFIGDYPPMIKYIKECEYVNGLVVAGIVTKNDYVLNNLNDTSIVKYNSYEELLNVIDAVYIVTDPTQHYKDIKKAFEKNKHVICQSPVCISLTEYKELQKEADDKGLILMEAIKTNHALAFNRMCLLLETGIIGDIVSIDSTCTVIREDPIPGWNSICAWGPTALLPVLRIAGHSPEEFRIISKMDDDYYDSFTKIDFIYKHLVATVKIGIGVKSEGELIISGTKGYVYVPAPWWKTDYFEIRYEETNQNKRYYYELLGEGTRSLLHDFLYTVNTKIKIDTTITETIVRCIEQFFNGNRKEI